MRSVVSAGRKLWLKFRRSDNIGRELVTNGSFDGNDTGWVVDSGGAGTIKTWVSSFGGREGVEHVNIQGTASASNRLKQNIDYISGARYKIQADIYVVSGVVRVDGKDANLLGEEGSDVITTSSTGSWVTYTGYGYTPSTESDDTDSIFIRALDSSTAEFYIDSISVKEISQFELDASSESNDAKLFTGKALSFDGTNDYVELPADLNETVWTCAMWLGDYVNPNSYDWLFGGETARSIGLANNPTDKIFFRSSTSTYYDFTTDTPSSYTGYKRFVFASDGTDISLYIDGVFMDSITPDDTHLRLRRIMAGYNTTSHLTEGKASDFQFYDSCWTANDAYLDYTYPNELLIDAGGSVARNSLRVHLPMSEGSGAVAFNSVRLGEDLITNGNFTDLPLGEDWSSLDGNIDTYNENGVTITSINTDQYNRLRQDSVTEDGKSYKVTYTIHATSYTAGTVVEYYDGDTYNALPEQGVGTHTFYFTREETNDNWYFNLDASSSASTTDFVTISSFSVREIVTPFDSIYNGAALGATWVTAQPTIPQLGMQDWSKGSNLFPTSESSLTLSDVTSSAVEGPAINSADALNTATRLTETTADDQHYSSAVFVAYSGIEYTLSVFVKKGTYDQIRLVTSSNRIQSNIYFTFSTEAFTATTYSPAAEDYGNGWYRLSWTATAKTDFGASGNCSLYLAPLDLSSYVGATSKYTDFFGWQVEIGDTMGNYIPTNGLLAQDATLTANPYNAGYDVVGNALKLRGEGLHLDGKGWAVVSDDASIDLTTELTIECWVKIYDNGGNYNILQKKSGWNTTGYGMYRNANGSWYFEASTTDTNDSYIQTGIDSLDDLDTWFHLAVVKIDGHIYQYVDGALVKTTDDADHSAANALDLIIGQGHGGSRSDNVPNFVGVISDVRIYNTPLAASGTTDVPTITAKVLNNYKVGKSKHS